MKKEDMLVQIYADFGSGDGKISTGYPVAKDRILTACHGLYDENGNLAQSLEVRWFYQLDKGKYDWQAAEMINCGLDEELDVALLKCKFPDLIDYDVRFCFKNPGQKLEWESQGFARAGKRDGERPPIPIGGETYTAADAADWLVLTEKGKVEVPELWCGISGAPVFKSGSNELVGVIVECPPNHEAIRLYATPLWKLADNEKFRREVFNARERDWQQIRSDLQAILTDFPSLVNTLDKERGCDSNSTMADLLDALLNTKADELLKCCESAISILRKAKDLAAVERGKALVNYLLPILFDPHTVDLICDQARSGICRVAVGSDTVAEIVMSGKDGRSLKYRQTAEDKAPVGVYLLDSPSSVHGIGKAGWVSEFKRQIIEDFARLDELAVGQVQGFSEGDKLALAADELEFCAKDGQTRYYFYHAPKDAREKEELSSAIEELHRAFAKHVVFLECGSFDLTRKERRDINRPLKKIFQTQVEETL